MPIFDPTDLIGRTFLLSHEENGERHRAKVTRRVVEIIDQENGHRVESINFILDSSNGKVEELISYNQLLEHVENANTMIWAWIKNFLSSDPSLDTKVLWLNLIQIGKAANLMFQRNGRLGRPHMNPSPPLVLMTQLPVQHMPRRMIYLLWKDGIGSVTLPRKREVLGRAIKQSKIRQVRQSQTYMFGYLIPRNYMEVMQYDSENNNNKWYDAIKLEMESMLEYKVFKKWDKAILDKQEGHEVS